MSYYVHPDVKTLKVIADNFWDEPTLNSLATSSWAVQDPYSEAVTRFVTAYRKALEMDLHSMSNSKLEEELRHFEADIDDLFFFSLLTRKVEGKSGLNRLVGIRVMDGFPEGLHTGAYTKNKSAYIRMWRINQQGKPHRFQHLIHTVVHEMCHAFLDLFSDKRHRKHHDWVLDHGGHGEMFWVLFRFISRKLGAYTQSDRWREQSEWMERECYELTQTRGEPGSWGTPERTLMGSVLNS